MPIFPLLALLPVCIAIGYFSCIFAYKKKQLASEKKMQDLIDESKRAADKIKKEADLAVKTELFQRREAFEKETQETKMELRQQEKR
ncbi:MAG: Rnase Y domain-containing protein, partial [Planctomycetota bacterium]